MQRLGREGELDLERARQTHHLEQEVVPRHELGAPGRDLKEDVNEDVERRRAEVVEVDFVVILARVHRHDELFERGVARALADAIDRALDLLRAVLHRQDGGALHHADRVAASRDGRHAVIDVDILLVAGAGLEGGPPAAG